MIDYFRAAKRARREAKEEAKQRCYDWMITSGVNYARDRSAFTEHIPIKPTTITTAIYSTSFEVVGVGIVKLDVLCSPGSSETKTITLNPVLHIPAAVCNGINDHVNGVKMVTGQTSRFLDTSGEPVFYSRPLQPSILQAVALANHPKGVQPLLEVFARGGHQSLSVFLKKADALALRRAIVVACVDDSTLFPAWKIGDFDGIVDGKPAGILSKFLLKEQGMTV